MVLFSPKQQTYFLFSQLPYNMMTFVLVKITMSASSLMQHELRPQPSEQCLHRIESPSSTPLREFPGARSKVRAAAHLLLQR
mmetsp:Transcript_22083/g.43458  ORF Transcript_22083/g.43458 Transcript_22083/m.43458 type:complete len:82 (+) Transcript_22083:47-292(+)